MQGLAADDLIDFTPELRRRAQQELEGIRTGGLFLPASTEGSLAVPGWGGGSELGRAPPSIPRPGCYTWHRAANRC